MEKLTRRKFVKLSAAATAGGAIGGMFISPAGLLAATQPQIGPSKRVLVYNASVCTGCRQCETACSLCNEGVMGSGLSRIHIRGSAIHGNDFGVSVCQQCVEPLCLKTCPADAISVDPVKGTRVVDEASCTGCSECIAACPFTPPNVRLNKEKGVAFKCEVCDDPLCVKMCVHNALSVYKSDRGINTGYPYKV